MLRLFCLLFVVESDGIVPNQTMPRAEIAQIAVVIWDLPDWVNARAPTAPSAVPRCQQPRRPRAPIQTRAFLSYHTTPAITPVHTCPTTTYRSTLTSGPPLSNCPISVHLKAMDAIIALIPPKVAAYVPGLDNSHYVYATGTALVDLVDVSKPSLWIAAGAVLFNPIYWNIVARNGT